MSPVVDTFERRARRIRRTLRRIPLLEPLANRFGLLAWRWHLRRISRDQGAELDPPTHVLIDPSAIDRGGRPPPRESLDEVEVAMGPRGRLSLVAGHAKVDAALRRGESGLSARVASRHPRWARTATEVRAYAAQRGGTAYQPYLHPDLADIPSDQGHERFDLLLGALPIRSGVLVDLGANAGYFSHRFEQVGFDCVAVERSAKEAYFLEALREACGREFRILKGSLTQVELPPRIDLVLALNIFHHFLKTESSFRELQEFLRRLDTRYMLFEPHLVDDPQMARASHNLPPERFAERVAEWAGLEIESEVGRAADGRPLYLLAAPSSS